jgi:hypothetical protein
MLHGLIAMIAGWLQRHRPQVITSLMAESRVLLAQLGGRQRLQELATLVTLETL